MAQLDKKNDPNWCMQLLAPFFGVVFLLLGFSMFLGSAIHGYGYIALGLVWFAIGFVHGARWRRKKRAFQQGESDFAGSAADERRRPDQPV